VKKLRVGVIYGGRSGEHEVSLASAAAVFQNLDPERYAIDFAFPHPAVREVAFRDPDDGDRLVGLGIFDETPRALSAVYFYFDPDEAARSPGVLNVLSLIEDCRRRGVPFLYLGYWVAGSPNMAYKAGYRPNEVLGEDGCWRPGS